MKRLIMLFVPLLTCAVLNASEAYTYVDLLNELVNLEQLAVLPREGRTCQQFSSYDRRSRYDEATGRYLDWGANRDWTGYVREEGDTWVVAEMDGPGVVWRIWTVVIGEMNFRIYLDGQEVPVIDMPAATLFDGGVAPFNQPELVYRAAGGAINSYLPIPYQKTCKIVVDKDSLYKHMPGVDEPGWFYHMTYTTYPEGIRLPTFTMNLGDQEQAALERINRTLSARGVDPAGSREGEKKERRTITVNPGQAEPVFNLSGTRAITALKVKPEFEIEDGDDDLLRKLALSIYWDDDILPAVWSPLGDFFGTAPGVNHYRSLPMGMTEDGFYSYWYMPFAQGARIYLTNDGTDPYTFTFELTHSKPTRPIETLGRFHAKWHRGEWLPMEPERRAIDWTMLITRGRGRYCGVMLHVWNPHGGWWGEGDEKIYVDGEKFPSTFGTGTEDYFGYAYGIASLFDRAFHNQTRSNQRPDEPLDHHEGNRGHISVNRWHVADNIPFQQSIYAAMERYWPHEPERPTVYAAVAYWYQEAGQIDPYLPAPVERRVGYWDVPMPLGRDE